MEQILRPAPDKGALGINSSNLLVLLVITCVVFQVE